ncbi:MAG: glycosyltransferase family 2 protein [Rhodothalassiaceae bacterium]
MSKDPATAPMSVVLPFYNEQAFLPASLACLAAQTVRPLKLILVDNASSDGSTAVARQCLQGTSGIKTVFLQEPRPGKCAALQTGLKAVDTPFVALCDADTAYPPHYLAQALQLFEAGGADLVACLAMGVSQAPTRWRAQLKRRKGVMMSTLFPRHCHTGGYGFVLRTQALRQAGGYDPDAWPFTLMDHEQMARIFKLGRGQYHPDLWCQPSARRADRSSVRWTLPERLLYQALPFAAHDWFFHRFLARRFRARRLQGTALREQPWRRAR